MKKRILSILLSLILALSYFLNVPNAMSVSAEGSGDSSEWIAASPKTPVTTTLESSELLSTLMENYTSFVVVRHRQLGGSHYAYTEALSDTIIEKDSSPNNEEANYRVGGELVLVELEKSGSSVKKTETVLLSDGDGIIRDPDVSPDGTKILFSWSKAKQTDDFHLYEYDLLTDKYRQLTFGVGVADTEPKYLPDGNIIFSSTRMTQIIDCFYTPVSNLYLCGANGENIVRVGYDQVHTTYPTVTDDGRVLYTRWDYNDRTQVYTQAIFQMFPDGTNQTEVYGNNTNFPPSLLHTRQVAGTTDKYISIASGHHCYQVGKLCIVDTSKGRNAKEAENETVSFIVGKNEQDELPYIKGGGDEYHDTYGNWGFVYKYPYSVTSDTFLVAGADIGYSNKSSYEAEKTGWGNAGWGNSAQFKIYIMNTEGEREELVGMSGGIGASQIVPIVKRALFERPSMVNYGSSTGTYYIGNIYEGDGLKGVEKGTAKYLRVVALDYRAYSIGNVGVGDTTIDPKNSGQAFGAVSVGNGAWDTKRVLGIVPIEEDGSALFKVPSETPVYFQVLDENGYMIQSMRSWSTLMPGETFSCVGCHEDKNTVPPASATATMAMKKGVQELKPDFWQDSDYDPYTESKGFSYLEEIQPILDESCVSCHNNLNASKSKAGVSSLSSVDDISNKATSNTAFSLEGYRFGVKTNEDNSAFIGKAFPISYLVLTGSRGTQFNNNTASSTYLNWINTMSDAEMLAPYTAGSAKSPIITLLRNNHKNTNLTEREIRAIAAWIDLGVPACGEYDENNIWTANQTRWAEESQNKRDFYDKMNDLARKTRSDGDTAPLIDIKYKSGSVTYSNTYKFASATRLEIPKAYATGDTVTITLPEGEYYLGLTLNSRMGENILYIPSGKYTFTVPDNLSSLYTPTFKLNSFNTITARVVSADELLERHKLSVNVYDSSANTTAYPHASASGSYNDTTDAVRNVIDGISGNGGYGEYPNHSWGADSDNSWILIDFARPVNVDEIELRLRADFASNHDTYFESATLEFSDGSTEKINLKKTAEKQSFTLSSSKTTTYIKLQNLVKADSANEYVGLSEFTAYGNEAKSTADSRAINIRYNSSSTVYQNTVSTPTLTTLSVPKAYTAGDTVTINLPEGEKYLGLTLNDKVGEAILYVPSGTYTYTVPAAATMSAAFEPTFASNSSNTIKARIITATELSARRNLALNPYDLDSGTSAYPHVTASDWHASSPMFAPRNAIDGFCDNTNHNAWPYQSWGPSSTGEHSIKIDFGTQISVNEIAFYLRSDNSSGHTFYKSAVLEFSDGSTQAINFQETLDKQTFTFTTVTTSYIIVKDFVKVNESMTWAGITEIEVYGSNTVFDSGDDDGDNDTTEPEGIFNLIEYGAKGDIYTIKLNPALTQGSDYTTKPTYNNLSVSAASGDFVFHITDTEDKNGNGVTTDIYPAYGYSISDEYIFNAIAKESNTDGYYIAHTSGGDNPISNRSAIGYDLGSSYSLDSLKLIQSLDTSHAIYNFSVYAGDSMDATIFNNLVASGGSKTETELTVSLNDTKARYILIVFDHVSMTYNAIVNKYSYSPKIVNIAVYGERAQATENKNLLYDSASAQIYTIALDTPLINGAVPSNISYNNLTPSKSWGDFTFLYKDIDDINGNGSTTDLVTNSQLGVSTYDVLNELASDGNTNSHYLAHTSGGTAPLCYRMALGYDLGRVYSLADLTIKLDQTNGRRLDSFSVYAGSSLDATIFSNKIGTGGGSEDTLTLNLSGNTTRYILIVFDLVSVNGTVNQYAYDPTLTSLSLYGEKSVATGPVDVISEGIASGDIYTIKLDTPLSQGSAYTTTPDYNNLSVSKSSGDFIFHVIDSEDNNNNGVTTDIYTASSYGITDEFIFDALSNPNNTVGYYIGHSSGGDSPLTYRSAIGYSLNGYYKLDTLKLTQNLSTGHAIYKFSVYAGDSMDATIFDNLVASGGSKTDTELTVTLGNVVAKYVLIVFDHVSMTYNGIVNRYSYSPSITNISLIGEKTDKPTLLGDMDKNNVVNIIDYIYLTKAISGDITIPASVADLNRDGYINTSDLIYLKKLLLGIKL